MTMLTSTGLYSNGNTLYGTFASRPAPGVAGRTFIPTDGYYPCRDTGSAWVTQAIPGFDNINPPAYNDAGWSQIHFSLTNSGTAAVAADGDGLLFTQSGNNSTSNCDHSCLVTSIPGSGAYDLIVGLELTLTAVPHTWGGICLTDGNGATPKIVSCHLYTGDTSQRPYVAVWYFNNPTSSNNSGAGTINETSPIGHSGKIFFKIHDDRTANLTFFYSLNGSNWIKFNTAGRTAQLIPAYAGVILSQLGTNINGGYAIPTTQTRSIMRIFHWSLG